MARKKKDEGFSSPASPTGGQSRITGPVLVTPSGEAVASALVPRTVRRTTGATRVGGQSRPEGEVLVTPEGEAVATVTPIQTTTTQDEIRRQQIQRQRQQALETLEPGTPVGTGIRGGTLVVDPSSPTGTREIRQTIPPPRRQIRVEQEFTPVSTERGIGFVRSVGKQGEPIFPESRPIPSRFGQTLPTGEQEFFIFKQPQLEVRPLTGTELGLFRLERITPPFVRDIGGGLKRFAFLEIPVLRESKLGFQRLGRERDAVTPLVVTEFIPTTPFDVGLIYGGVKLIRATPTVGRIIFGGGIAGVEARTIVSPDVTIEKRIAAGLIGGLAITGATFEALPFVRGGVSRLRGARVARVQPEGFKALELKEIRVGIIPRGDPLATGETLNIKLPKISPLRRGGFGVREAEKRLFLSRDQQLATSQIGLFKEGVRIPIEREFFVTPQEPFIKIPETRISRLGIQEPFKFPRQTQVGFGIPGQPQIGITIAGVGRLETPTQFRIGTGTELEAIKSFGTIEDVRKITTVVIKGQRVDIFGFRVGREITGDGIRKGRQPITTEGLTRVSGESVLGVGGLTQLKTTTKLPTLITPPFTTTTIPKITTTIPVRRRTGVSRRGRQPTFPTVTPSIPTIPITPPTTILTPPKTPRRLPPTIPITPPRTPIIPPVVPPTLPPDPFKSLRQPRRITPKFPVLVRRGGIFKIAGFGRTRGEAIRIGRGITSRTLARTFRIPKGSPLKVPGFRTKKEKEGLVFIEPSRRALGTPTELKEIQFFKRLRGGK